MYTWKLLLRDVLIPWEMVLCIQSFSYDDVESDRISFLR